VVVTGSSVTVVGAGVVTLAEAVVVASRYVVVDVLVEEVAGVSVVVVADVVVDGSCVVDDSVTVATGVVVAISGVPAVVAVANSRVVEDDDKAVDEGVDEDVSTSLVVEGLYMLVDDVSSTVVVVLAVS
jgi:hypothetical protein